MVGVSSTLVTMPLPDEDFMRQWKQERERIPSGMTTHSTVAELVNGMQAAVHPLPVEYDGYPLVMFREAAQSAIVHWLVKGIAEQGSMGAFYGQSGSGKSFLFADLCLSLARQEPWMGYRTHGGPVLLVAAEAGNSIRRRVKAYMIENGLEDANLQFAHIEVAPNLLSDADVNKVIASVGELSKRCETETVFVGIDTLSRAMDGDDGSGVDMPKFVRACDHIRTETKAAMGLVHHTGHSAQERARGHSSFRAALDWEIQVEGLSGTRTATITKVRDEIAGQPMAFSLKSVEIGPDDDGDMQTSCTVEMAETPKRQERGRKAITGQAGVAFKALQRAIEEAGTEPIPSNHIPQGAKVVSLDLWREYCRQTGLVDSDKPDSFRQAFHRAKASLFNRGAIGVWSDCVWIV